jgi:hypothetical protein
MEDFFNSIERHHEAAFWLGCFILIVLTIIASMFNRSKEE